jgi:hypothetical protein
MRTTWHYIDGIKCILWIVHVGNKWLRKCIFFNKKSGRVKTEIDGEKELILKL